MSVNSKTQNPHDKYPVPPFPKQKQEVPGTVAGATIPVTGGRITI